MVSQNGEMAVKSHLSTRGKKSHTSHDDRYIEYEDENMNGLDEPETKHFDFKVLDEFFEFHHKKQQNKPIQMTPMTEEIFKLQRPETTILEAMSEYVVNNIPKINSIPLNADRKDKKYSRKIITDTKSLEGCSFKIEDEEKSERVSTSTAESDSDTLSENHSSSGNNHTPVEYARKEITGASTSGKLRFTRKFINSTPIIDSTEHSSCNGKSDHTDVQDTNFKSPSSKLRFHRRFINSGDANLANKTEVKADVNLCSSKLRFHRKLLLNNASSCRDLSNEIDNVKSIDVNSVEKSNSILCTSNLETLTNNVVFKRFTRKVFDVKSSSNDVPTHSSRSLQLKSKFFNKC